MVAVKVFLNNMEGKVDTVSSHDLLQIARHDTQLHYAYKEIRQEVEKKREERGERKIEEKRERGWGEGKRKREERGRERGEK